MRWLKYVVFGLVMWGTFYWVTVSLFWSSLGKEKTPMTVIENQELQQLIKDKTGVTITNIKISETEQPFAVMIGIPTRPQLIISRGVYDNFSPAAMEYVILHETGHYRLWQGPMEIVAMLILLILGIFLIKKFAWGLIPGILLGLICGSLLIQLGKFNEILADKFAAKTITDPQGMIEATNNFRNYHGQKYTENDNKLLQWLFYRSNPYDNRIKMAKEEIKT